MARVPLYRKAETEMLRRIRSGEWEVGRRLPNEFGLANEFGVSQGTMRRALITLESQGLLARKPGRGTVVAKPGTASSAAKGPKIGFDRLSRPDGTAPTLEIFRSRSSTRRADSDEAELMGEARVLVAERMLKLANDRFALDEIVLPESLLAEFDEEAAEDLPALLTAHGLEAAEISDRLTAEMCSMSESVALSVDRNTALLVLTRVARDKSGRVLARQVLKMISENVGYGIVLQG